MCVCVLFWGSGQNAKMREMNAKRQMDSVLICDILCTALYTSACVCVRMLRVYFLIHASLQNNLMTLDPFQYHHHCHSCVDTHTLSRVRIC